MVFIEHYAYQVKHDLSERKGKISSIYRVLLWHITSAGAKGGSFNLD